VGKKGGDNVPIYEYQAVEPDKGCDRCSRVFEVIQAITEPSLEECPLCNQKIKRLISRCYAAVIEQSEEALKTERQITEYEKAGMWSHAAELADKYSEKTKDKAMKTRALEDYRKAGYDVDRWSGGD
jgi:putative FmdB family regulatory protein